MGNVIAVLVIVAIVGGIICFLVKQHKNGGGCPGCKGGCNKSCSIKSNDKDDEIEK